MIEFKYQLTSPGLFFYFNVFVFKPCPLALQLFFLKAFKNSVCMPSHRSGARVTGRRQVNDLGLDCVCVCVCAFFHSHVLQEV